MAGKNALIWVTALDFRWVKTGTMLYNLNTDSLGNLSSTTGQALTDLLINMNLQIRSIKPYNWNRCLHKSDDMQAESS